MLTIDAPFTLTEQGHQYFAADFSLADTANRAFIELKGVTLSGSQHIVFLIIKALLEGQAAGIPVILNRTGQTIDKTQLPKHFCVGLLTSGTTGKPKVVFHTLEEILPHNSKRDISITSRWLLCYHPMSFAGLQVILQAVVTQDTLVADTSATLSERAQIAIDINATAISATPSMMRAMLMSWQSKKPPLSLISLGGEIADQATLNALKSSFPSSQIRHIYATTESGVVFTIKDGVAGFPSSWLKQEVNGWNIDADCTLKLNKSTQSIDTGDAIKVTENRVYFIGRQDNIVNVGGVKVNLENIEQAIIALTEVTDARVFAKSNPITGALICVELSALDQVKAKSAVNHLSQQLDAPSRPRIITFSKEITLTEAGKKQRFVQ